MKRLFIMIFAVLIFQLYADSPSDVSRLKHLGFVFPDRPVISPPLLVYEDDHQLNLASQNKVTLLYFWSSLIPSSLSDLSLLEILSEKMKDEELLIAPVNLNEDYQGVQELMKTLNVNMEIFCYPDPESLPPFIMKSVPSAYIIDKWGRIVASIQGNAPWGDPDIQKTLKELASE